MLPYLFFLSPGASTVIPLVIGICLALVSMVVVGSIVGRLSGRGMAFSAARQVMWGVGAAGVTYLIGRLVGVNIG